VTTMARVTRQGQPPAPTATYVVRFEQRPKRAPERKRSAPAGRVPRIARLLALAHRLEGMIGSGEIRDWAEAARLAGVTRARMTQISHLLSLAPDIQETILYLPGIGVMADRLTEHIVRSVEASTEWEVQRRAWEKLAVSCRQ